MTNENLRYSRLQVRSTGATPGAKDRARLPLAESVPGLGSVRVRARVVKEEFRQKGTVRQEGAGHLSSAFDLEDTTLAAPRQTHAARGRSGRDVKERRRRWRRCVGDDIERVQPEVRGGLLGRKGLEQFQIAEHDISLIAEQVSGEDCTEHFILEVIFGGKPDLATGPEVNRVEAVVADGVRRMETGEQLLVAAHD